MEVYPLTQYSSYQFTVGDTDFTFFAIPSSLAEIQSSGTTMHSHKFYELFHVLRGNITVFTEVGEVSLKDKDTAIISPDLGHTTAIKSSSLRICISFSMQKNKKAPNSNYYETFQTIFKNKIVRLDSFAGSHAFRRFARYFQSDLPEKDELLTACLHEIMVLIKSAHHAESTTSSLLIDSNHMRTYIIDDYFTNQFHKGSLNKLAEMLHLSTQQTQRIVKNMYHQSFSERITMMKMQYAKTLLLDTDLSVSQIAEKCGYSGTNGFFVSFKKYYGTTPNELRHSLAEE